MVNLKKQLLKLLNKITNSSSEEVLWINESPETAMGADGFTKDLSEYDLIKIVASGTSSTTIDYFMPIDSGNSLIIDNMDQGLTTTDGSFETRLFTVESTGVSWTTVYHKAATTSTSRTLQASTRCSPLIIYGIKM